MYSISCRLFIFRSISFFTASYLPSLSLLFPSLSSSGCPLTAKYPWVGMVSGRRAWQASSVFLLGEFHGQRRLAGCTPWDYKASDTTEWLTLLLLSSHSKGNACFGWCCHLAKKKFLGPTREKSKQNLKDRNTPPRQLAIVILSSVLTLRNWSNYLCFSTEMSP